MIYFDNAATTLRKPKQVTDAVMYAMENFGNPGRAAHGGSLDAARTVYEARKALAELFGAEPSGIAFTNNATTALNMAIKGLLAPGDNVVTTVMEHNSVLRPLYEMKNKGITISIAGLDDELRLDIDKMRKLITDDTRAVIVNHGSNLTGNINDIYEIKELIYKRDILLVVDASQTAGFADIDMKEMGIDVLCFTGHKALMGPQGTGGICVREGIKISPLITGGSGMNSFSRTHPDVMPEALEAGTLNTHGIAGLLAAVKYIEEKGIENIREKEFRLTEYFIAGVEKIAGIELVGNYKDDMRCPIASINAVEYSSSQVSDELWNRYEIATRAGAHCAPLMHEALGTKNRGAVRFSFSHYNTEDEIDEVLEALKEILR